jgi:hypothetical protein
VLTIDVMLSAPAVDFTGADFLASPVRDFSSGVEASKAFSAPGDAVVFNSLKYHSVAQLTSGIRRVLVIELWEGPERGCGHRCEKGSSAEVDCDVRPVASLIEDHLDDFEDQATRDAAMRFLKQQQPPSSAIATNYSR